MAKNDIIFQKLIKIRELRNKELFDAGDNSVFYTDAMALEVGKTGQQIYRIMEEYSIGENQSLVRELFYTYTNEPELIAIIDPEKDGKIRQPEGKEAKTEEQKAEWELLLRDIEEGIVKSKDNIIKQAMKIGIDQKEIEGLSELDIQKRIIKKIDEKNNGKNKDNKEGKDAAEAAPFRLSGESAQKHGIIGVNTISLNQQVGVKGETLKKELGLDEDEQYADVSQIEIIPSYKVRELGVIVPDTPFIAVARHRDGSVEAFPKRICSVYKGANNRTIEFDEKNVTNKTPKTILQFNNAKGAALAINQTAPYGRVDASLVYTPRNNDKRIALNLIDKYEGIDRINYEARDTVSRRHGTEHIKNIIKEKAEHDKAGCDETEIEDANGNPNDGHIHFNPEDPKQKEAIEEIIEKSSTSPEHRIPRKEAETLFAANLKSKDNPKDGQERIKYAKEQVLDELEQQYLGGDPRKR